MPWWTYPLLVVLAFLFVAVLTDTMHIIVNIMRF
jgi:hypothetical protein